MGKMVLNFNVVIISIILFAVHTIGEDVFETASLFVRQINENGFGDNNNQYAFSMEKFKNYLYIGTLNCVGAPECLTDFFLGNPLPTNGTQIYRGYIKPDGNWKWDCVVSSGNTNKHNYGVRKLQTVASYLYAVTANHISGFEVWRTHDGINWEVVVEKGFGDIENTSGRGLLSYKGYLYIGAENRITGAKIYRRALAVDGDFKANNTWHQVTCNGFGHVNNQWFSDFAEYKGWMYIGALNMFRMQLWRTDGVEYENVFKNAHLSPFDMGVMKLYVYNNVLYVGTMNWRTGANLYANIDEEGVHFKRVFSDGNGNEKNTYVWYMQEFNHRLYVGTFKRFYTFDLYSSVDPLSGIWTVETNNSFNSNKGYYGIRCMEEFEGKLILGTATALQNGSCKVFEATARDTISGKQIKINLDQYFNTNYYNSNYFKIIIIVIIVVVLLLVLYNFWLLKKINDFPNKC